MRIVIAFLSATFTFIVAAVAPAPAWALAALPALAPRLGCADLLKIDFSDPANTELPFRLNSASEASFVPPGGKGAVAYCQVTGYAPSQVKFEVRLPVQGWTQRFLMLGCGGYCGAVLMPGDGQLNTAWNCAPVNSGELVLATHNGGHDRIASGATPGKPGPFADGLWARDNPGAVVDFAYKGVHKATVAAKALIKAYYGQPQRYAYYSGCSDGGRAGLQLVQRYPADYDGLQVGAAAIDEVQTNTFYHAWNVRSNTASTVPNVQPAQYLPILTSDKIPALRAAVLAACADFGNGLKDMIRDPRACKLDARRLVCSGAESASCLTPAQAEVVNKLWQGPVDETGQLLSAGDMPYGSEAAWPGNMVTAAGVPLSLATATDYQFSWDFPRYMAQFGEPLDIDVRNMAFTRAGYRALTQLVPLYNPTNVDIRPFLQRGGKLLLWHGWADPGTSPWMTLNYYTKAREFVGNAAADRGLTLYMVPGVYHCNGGPAGSAQDFQTPLMNWVEDGAAPARIVVDYYADAARATLDKQRPVWPYPSLTQYNGTGDPKSAASFSQQAPRERLPETLEWIGLKDYAPGGQMVCDGRATGLDCRMAARP